MLKDIKDKKVFIKDVKEKDRVEGVFLVSKKESALSKNGKPYLVLNIMDRTGSLEGRVWENAEELSRLFSKNDFVFVTGWAVSYRGGIQINISTIEKYPETDIALHDFLPSSPRDIEEMMDELKGIVAGMENQYLKRLLNLFIEDKEISNLWRQAPAAKGMHHAYLGGLLEHTVSISKLAMSVVKHYDGIDADILLTGTILHDIGKIYELSYSRAFDYSDQGRLLGHISIGAGMVDDKIKKIPGFPEGLKAVVKHMILSHHGHLEFGSPTTPKTVEAIMLYFLDDMDSKVQSVQNLIRNEEANGSNWTSYHRLYERHIYKGISYNGECLNEDGSSLEEGKGMEDKKSLAHKTEEFKLFP